MDEFRNDLFDLLSKLTELFDLTLDKSVGYVVLVLAKLVRLDELSDFRMEFVYEEFINEEGLFRREELFLIDPERRELISLTGIVLTLLL